MSKQAEIHEHREPSNSPPTSREKEDGDESNSGSFYDKADMQRLGKEQELKVCRPCSQDLRWQCKCATTTRSSNDETG